MEIKRRMICKRLSRVIGKFIGRKKRMRGKRRNEEERKRKENIECFVKG